MPRVAIIEDNEETNNAYARALRSVDIDVEQFYDVKTAKSGIHENEYDAYILDLDISKFLRFDGLSIVPFIQAKISDSQRARKSPILVVSGHPPEEYKNISKNFFTAWDYVEKPISLENLTSLVWEIIHFAREEETKKAEIVDQIMLDNADVYWKGKKIHGVSMILYKMLNLLVHSDGPVSYRNLYRCTNTNDTDPQRVNTAVRVHITRLRRAFKDVDPSFKMILSVHGFGYEWEKK